MAKLKFFILMGLLVLPGVGLAEIVVIANPGNDVQSLSELDVKRIYLGKMNTFPNGVKIQAVDHGDDSKIKRVFYSRVIGKDISKLKIYWSRLIFAGKARPPKVVGDDDDVKAFVAAQPNAIGYIDRAHVDGSVRVVYSE